MGNGRLSQCFREIRVGSVSEFAADWQPFLAGQDVEDGSENLYNAGQALRILSGTLPGTVWDGGGSHCGERADDPVALLRGQRSNGNRGWTAAGCGGCS